MIAEKKAKESIQDQYFKLGFKSKGKLDFLQVYTNPNLNIIAIHYQADAFIDLEKANETIALTRPFLKEGYNLAISDAREMGVVISKEANRIFKNYPAKDEAKALAIMVSNIPIRLMANFFINVEQPEVTTKAFNQLESAIEWLLKFEN